MEEKKRISWDHFDLYCIVMFVVKNLWMVILSALILVMGVYLAQRLALSLYQRFQQLLPGGFRFIVHDSCSFPIAVSRMISMYTSSSVRSYVRKPHFS